MTISPGGA